MVHFIQKKYIFFLFLAILSLVSFWVSNISPAPLQTHFVDLAYSFLHGRLDLIPPIRLFDDSAYFNGKYYVYFGLLPSLLIMPFVMIFGLNFPQEVLVVLTAVVTFIVIYQICRRVKINSSNALWLSTFFIFGTIYLFLTITKISAYYVQVVGLLFILLAILEFLGQRRFFIIGVCVGLAGLTRQTYYLSAIFFLLELIKNRPITYKRDFLLFLLGILIFININALYNYFRFKNALESGYSYQTNTNPIYLTAKKAGIFSLEHVPGNLYFLLFKGPDPIRTDNLTYILKPPYLRVNEWGLGLFFTSPLFLYLLLAKLKDRYVFSSLITTFFLSIPVLTYYGIGLWQYGYRYALDFYPFLFLILLSVFKDGLPLRAKALIIYSILFNLLFMYSIWYKYPFDLGVF